MSEEKQPKNKFEIAIYLANLASISLYLDKTGVEWHPQKENLNAEFMRVMDEYHEAIQRDKPHDA